MSAELFTIISVYENIFSDRKKMIRILSRAFLESCLCSILEKCDRNILVPHQERHRDNKEHSNNKVNQNSITSYYGKKIVP